jgi:RNA 2',3'-cyclic 3'-phosphodiesterase
MSDHRMFIAVELDPQLRDRVRALQSEMDGQLNIGQRRPQPRWTSPQNLHFTLRFLGEINTVQVARAILAAREVGRSVQPFAITIGHLGGFPSLPRARVFWLDTIDGATGMQTLAHALERALAKERFDPDPRRFRPHLTIGRLADQWNWGDLARVFQRFEHVVVGSQHVGAIVVVESRLTPKGPIYAVQEQVPLTQELNS